MIERAARKDAATVAKLAIKLWKDHTIDELTEEFEEILAQSESAVFLYLADGQAVGFAQCQLRHDYVEGTDSSPVGYLEGIFIRPEHRHNGYARELLARCEAWAKERGCTEFASDCGTGDTISAAFHLKTGFSEAARVICFTKKL